VLNGYQIEQYEQTSLPIGLPRADRVHRPLRQHGAADRLGVVPRRQFRPDLVAHREPWKSPASKASPPIAPPCPTPAPRSRARCAAPPTMTSREIPTCATAQPCRRALLSRPSRPWMLYQIQADSFPRGAFANGKGEMFSQTVDWEDGRRAEPVATSQDRSVILPVPEQAHHHRRKRQAALGEQARRAAIFMVSNEEVRTWRLLPQHELRMRQRDGRIEVSK
jgi:hypothetical protein